VSFSGEEEMSVYKRLPDKEAEPFKPRLAKSRKPGKK
jgi:hypothetical protein